MRLIKTKIIGLCVFLFISTNAGAITIEAGASETLYGSNGLINITENIEYFVSEDDFYLRYVVDIIDEESSTSIEAFAISTNTVNVFDWGLWSDFEGWSATQIDAATWDSGYAISTSSTTVSTADLGLFDSFFEGDLYVNIFMNDGDLNAINAGNDEGAREFTFTNSPLTSEFIALSGNGNIISQSLAPPVQSTNIPEPASLALMALGLVGVGFTSVRRKRQLS